VFATRQSDPKHVRRQIAASQTLLAMTGIEDHFRQKLEPLHIRGRA
jgi:hypothetical protein